ncbi:MAG: hypothetical protein ACRDZX_00125, partial [Acidimicrobiales bacterium]
GYDLEGSYIALAEARVAQELQTQAEQAPGAGFSVCLPAVRARSNEGGDPRARAIREGRSAREIARLAIDAAGFSGVDEGARLPGGAEVDFVARDHRGRLWLFDVAGAFTTNRAGLGRADALWKAIAKAAVLRQLGDAPFVLLTAGASAPGGAGGEALKKLTGPENLVRAVIEILGQPGWEELRQLSASQSGP